LKILDINQQSSLAFAERMTQKLDMEIVVVESAREAFVDSDVISTATVNQLSILTPCLFTDKRS
jgi:ornithine cyclodeaminase/alanine dehydrogenase-like protein (mu-crystallin family)